MQVSEICVDIVSHYQWLKAITPLAPNHVCSSSETLMFVHLCPSLASFTRPASNVRTAEDVATGLVYVTPAESFAVAVLAAVRRY